MLFSDISEVTGNQVQPNEADLLTLEQYKQFKSLYQLVQNLSQPANLQEIYDKAIVNMLDVLSVERVAILTLDEDDVMRFQAWHNLSDTYRAAVEGHMPWELDDPDAQPVLVTDVADNEELDEFRPLFSQEEIGALCFIPLLHKNKLIGKFMLYYERPHTFSIEEIHLAQIVASHVAPAIERLKTHEALRNYARQQSFIANLGQLALKNYVSLPGLISRLVGRVSEVLAADFSEVWELLPDGKEFVLAGGAGWQAGVVGSTRIKAGKVSQAGFTIKSGRPVIVRDMDLEDRFEVSDLMRAHEVTSGVTVVIEGGERPFGVLGVHTVDFRHFTRDEVNFLQAIANVLATAIQQKESRVALEGANNALEEKVAKRTDMLKREIKFRQTAEEALQRESKTIHLLKEVAATANDAQSIQEAFNTILRKICEFTDWPLAHVYMQVSEMLDGIQSDELISSGIWHCGGSGQFDFIRRVTAETSVKRGVDWIGEVFQSGKPAWIMDFYKSNGHERNQQLHAMGIAGAFAFPVLVESEVTAIMEFFTLDFKEPDEDLLAVMAQIGTLMGRIVERERARKERERNEQNLHNLAAHLIQAHDAERRHISNELHDQLGQLLSAIKLDLDMMAIDLDDVRLKKQLERPRMMTKKSMERMQQLAYDLRPPELDTIGLNAALQDLCRDFMQRADFAITYRGTQNLPAKISDTLKVNLYLALQEGLNNAVKHSGASLVDVQLSYDNEIILLHVIDDGHGLQIPEDADFTNLGLGLLGISERFALLGGKLSLTSESGEGTSFEIQVPIVRKEVT